MPICDAYLEPGHGVNAQEPPPAFVVRAKKRLFDDRRADLANPHGWYVVQKITKHNANNWVGTDIVEQGQRKRQNSVTSEVPQAWFVMLQDEASAGRVLVPLRPFLKFSRRMDKQLEGLEKRALEAMPQLKRRSKSRLTQLGRD